MHEDAGSSVLPRWRLTRWLVDPGTDVPLPIRASLVAGLYGTLPIFIGGVLNTLAVSTVIAARIPTWPFLLWAGAELALSAVRLFVLLAGRRAMAEGRSGPTDLYLMLALLWAALIGYGTFISIASGDWVAAALACLSAAAMVGGICFRNFGAPRLAAIMIALSLGPCAAAAVASGQGIMLVVAVQIPFYLFSMTVAAFQMNRMLVTTMTAERANDHKARHDALTGLLNRAGLAHQVKPWLHAEGPGLTLFYLDLDGFKAINDSLGHATGDRLIAAVGERLRTLVRAEDAAARIGGDEFVIASRHLDHGRAVRLADRLVAEIAGRSYAVGMRSLSVGVSIGLAMPGDGDNLDDLLAAADAALYRSKAQGGSRFALAERLPPRRSNTDIRRAA